MSGLQTGRKRSGGLTFGAARTHHHAGPQGETFDETSACDFRRRVSRLRWGFLFWGATTLPYQAWERAADDAAAQQALREQFPVNGIYGVPSVMHPPEELERLSQTGPTAFVFITAADGRPAMVPSIMVFGFVQEIVVAALVAALLSWAGAGMGFGGKIKLALLAGAISVTMTHLGDAIWWMAPWGWKLVTSLYEIVCFLIMGAVLAKMLPARS